MKHEKVLFFTCTDNHYWSKSETFEGAIKQLKSMTSKCELVVNMTSDLGAHVDDINGGVCCKTTELCQFIGRFKLSSGRLTAIPEPKKK